MGVDSSVERAEVCIVGAGIAGLNALFVASRYLRKGQRCVLVDRRALVGGMWNDTYDYVRLHQPHPLFTAGNIKWQWDKDPSYLASKPEVLDHLQHCLDVIEQRIEVDERFGWEYVSHEEAGGLVRTTIARGDETVVVESRKLVTAYGFGVRPNEPLTLTSDRVRSVSPDHCDVRGAEMRASDAPVWIVGGGKTAMDTAHTLITEYPGREVNLVAGSGTYFGSRDKMYPTRRRLTTGTRPNSFISLWRGYDGTNDAEFHEAFKEALGTWVTPTATNWVAGILSEAEAATIRNGLRDTVMDHVVDAVDANGSVDLVFRSGATRSVEPGSWVVNCTGYLLKHDPPYEPYVSATGNVASINTRSCTMIFSSYAGYFLTHLLMRDKLHRLPFYELDWHELRRHTNVAGVAAMAVFVHNVAIMLEALPLTVFLRGWGTNADLWYPPPRWLWGQLSFLVSHRRDRRHAQRTLDTIGERYQVRCGPLPASE